jgi:hypothetical protein
MYGQPINFPKNLVLIGRDLDKEQLKRELAELERLSES